MAAKLYTVAISYNAARTWIMLGDFEGEDDRFAIRAARQHYQIPMSVLACAVLSTYDGRETTQRRLERWEERKRVIFPAQRARK